MTHKACVAVVKEQVRAKEKQKRQRLDVLIATAFLAGAALCRWGQPMGG